MEERTMMPVAVTPKDIPHSSDIISATGMQQPYIQPGNTSSQAEALAQLEANSVLAAPQSRLNSDNHTKQSPGIAEQFPLPNSPFPPGPTTATPLNNSNVMDNKRASFPTPVGDSEDVDMDDEDGHAGSDNESITSTATSTRPFAKNKKGQKFYCTDFPPCQLSFTRSEHLARHIRKHTGERPFQCFCARRFSRMDNLRQHAQTVHHNEDIPEDSLAATGTRFQRQIRTDRVRPANRSRTSSLSQGTPHRGHSRNLSSSSVGSTTSSIGIPEDYRRRPMPLAMAGSSSTIPGLTLDTRIRNPPSESQYQQFYAQSPAGMSTPTSSLTPSASSPRSSGLQSPISIVPRALTWAGGVPRRRLSVPSAPLSYPLQNSQPQYPTSYASSVASSSASTYSNSGSVLASPTGSTFSDRSLEYATEAERRRRTWHPTTVSGLSGRPATSGLSFYRTPDSPRPIATTQPAAAQAVRLPGIDSFDRVHAQYTAPPRRPPSPMQLDDSSRPDSYSGTHKRRPSETQWDAMNQNLTRLEIANTSPRHSGQWNRSLETSLHTSTVTPSAPQMNTNPVHHQPQTVEYHPTPVAEPTTPRKKKREGWYAGPPSSLQESQHSMPPQRTSPEDSSSSDGVPTPSTTSTGDYQPAIMHSNGYVEQTLTGPRGDVPQKPYMQPAPHLTTYSRRPVTPPRISHTEISSQAPRPAFNMARLDALAAVATSANHGSLTHQT